MCWHMVTGYFVRRGRSTYIPYSLFSSGLSVNIEQCEPQISGAEIYKSRTMVLKLDGNSEKSMVFFSEKKYQFVTSLDLIKCLSHIKRLLPKYAHITE